MFQGNISHRARFMGQTWGPPGSCRPQMGPMLAPWTLLSGCCWLWLKSVCNSPGTAALADVGGMDRYLTITKDNQPETSLRIIVIMMTSWNRNIFRVTGPLCGEITGRRWIPPPPPPTSDAELWCFLWFASWINGWVNSCEVADLRGNRDHYDVIVMCTIKTLMTSAAYMRR